jgi:predicted nucleotidyltransferase
MFTFATKEQTGSWSVRQLAEASGLSKSNVAKDRQELLDRRVLRESELGFDIRDKARLQEELLRGYELALRPRLLIGRFRSSDSDLDGMLPSLRVLQNHGGALGAELVVIGAIARQVHFPAESRHTGDIDFAVASDLDEFGELEHRLLADGWVHFANREHRWRSEQGTVLDQIPAGLKLRDAKQVTWPISQFTMSLVGFDHVFATAQPVQFAPDLMLKVISSSALMFLKIVAFMDDQQRRAKDLDDIRGLLVQYEAHSDRVFSDLVIDAALEDYGLAPAFLIGSTCVRCARTRRS